MRTWGRVVATMVLVVTAGCAVTAPRGDPASGGWEQVSTSPLSARHEAVGVWTGRVFLIVGGSSAPPCGPGASCAQPPEPPLRDGAAFDPALGVWSQLPDAPVPVSAWGNAQVVNESLYLLTWDLGRADSPQAMLKFDPRAGSWDRLPLPPDPTVATLVAAGDRLIAVAGTDEYGSTVDSWFDESTQRWRRLPPDPLGPSFNREAVWTGGALLLAAAELVPNPGSEKPAVARLARLDRSGRWVSLGATEIIGGSPIAVDGRVVWPMRGSADGGEVNNWGRHFPFGGILDPAAMTWSPLPDSDAPDNGLVGYPVQAGDSLLVDGQLLRPSTNVWTHVPAGPWRAQSSMTVIGNDQFLMVWGGSTDRENTNEGYVLKIR